MGPRLALGTFIAVVACCAYGVWTFLNAQDEEDDTELQFLGLGLGLAVIFWALLLTVLLLLALCWSTVLPGYRLRFWKVPGYAGWPLLGNLLDIQRSWHGLHEQGAVTFGAVFKLWYGAEPHIVTASSEACKQVLVKCPMVSEFPVPLWLDDRQVLLDGLPFAKNMAYHKLLRSVWAPAFNPASLAGYHPIMVQHADRLIEVLAKVADMGQSVDIWRLLIRTSMAVVASTGFGVDVDLDSQADSSIGTGRTSTSSDVATSGGSAKRKSKAEPPLSLGNRVVSAFQVILDASRPSKTGFWLPFFLMLHPNLRGPVRVLANLIPDETMARVKKAQQEIRSVAHALIQQERQLQKLQAEQSEKAKGTSTVPGIKAGSFLKHLLATKSNGTEQLTEPEVVANVYAFLGGGAETPANAMTYTIYQLALHPNCEERLLQEVDAASPSHFEQRHLAESFPFVHACFCEAMRTLPPVSKILREATESLTLAGTSISVSKGTKFEVSLRCAMRDPAAWNEPLLFQPSRFLPGSEWYQPDASAFMPFGGGQRMCIGVKFAHQMAKLLLVKLYSRFTFSLEPGVAPLRLATGISMAPEDGVRVRVHSRLRHSMPLKTDGQ